MGLFSLFNKSAKRVHDPFYTKLSNDLLKESRKSGNNTFVFCCSIFHLASYCYRPGKKIPPEVENVRLCYYNDRVYFEIALFIFIFFSEIAEKNGKKLDAEVKNLMNMIISCFRKVFTKVDFEKIFMERLALYQLSFKFNDPNLPKDYLYNLIKLGKQNGSPEYYTGEMLPVNVSEHPLHEILLNAQVKYICDELLSMLNKMTNEYLKSEK